MDLPKSLEPDDYFVITTLIGCIVMVISAAGLIGLYHVDNTVPTIWAFIIGLLVLIIGVVRFYSFMSGDAKSPKE
jgi:hypothetical protein